jgi:hypothetical protein
VTHSSFERIEEIFFNGPSIPLKNTSKLYWFLPRGRETLSCQHFTYPHKIAK